MFSPCYRLDKGNSERRSVLGNIYKEILMILKYKNSYPNLGNLILNQFPEISSG